MATEYYSGSPLQHVERFINLLEPFNVRESASREYSWQARCPAHDDNRPSLSIDVNNAGDILLRCHARCETKDILSALELEWTDLYKPNAFANPLKRRQLAEYPYHDANGTLRYIVRRYQYADGSKNFSQGHIGLRGEFVANMNGVERLLYNLPDVVAAVFLNESIAIVEGEKDVETLREIGIVATTISGGANAHWKRALVDPYLKGADVVLIPDNDDAGYGYAKNAAKALDGVAASVRLLELPGLQTKEDVTDWLERGNSWLAEGMIMEDATHFPVYDAETLRKLIADAPAYTSEGTSNRGRDEDYRNAETLEQLAKPIKDELNSRASRADKERIAKAISDLLLRTDRLFVEEIGDCPMPYAMSDQNAIVGLSGKSMQLKLMLQDCGLNPAEPTFHWIAEQLAYTAIRQGRRIRMARYGTVVDGRVYVSCGTSNMVVADFQNKVKQELVIRPNGYDGVLFAADACFPAWTPTEITIGLPDLILPCALMPPISAPPETPNYTDKAQRLLLSCWLINVITGETLMPVLALIGGKGSGKSTTAKAIVRLFCGSGGDVSTIPGKRDDFEAVAASLRVYAIDNLDGKPDKWFQDSLAAAVTGVSVKGREYYTKGDLYEKRFTAAFIVTTRTASFSSRPDVVERTLPMFYGDIGRESMQEERDLLEEIDQRRNELMTRLTVAAARSELRGLHRGGRDSRFQSFARLAEHLEPKFGGEYIRAWVKAQTLSITDDTPLLAAFLHWLETNKGETLSGSPSEILRKIDPFKSLPSMGGKAASREIRELRSALVNIGYEFVEDKYDDSTIFKIGAKDRAAQRKGEGRK